MYIDMNYIKLIGVIVSGGDFLGPRGARDARGERFLYNFICLIDLRVEAVRRKFHMMAD